jgi:hypothetical protein
MGVAWDIIRCLAFFITIASLRGDWVIAIKGPHGESRILISDSAYKTINLNRHQNRFQKECCVGNRQSSQSL